ncbi:hypothetical protein GCK72_023581 [Caenorhabditis remanei]|uniref:Uncharacterized protein n=1 Tax=Caenorhabditis remanei TaxID=31234 RepID=A0A6A5FX67_CAERE|nr:hypothetical protein GCK72_023581 [Caenorhabditis remanei]KAF1747122.1 hypothetical protein GCK72_023581 [Caenorhabditis remanei]
MNPPNQPIVRLNLQPPGVFRPDPQGMFGPEPPRAFRPPAPRNEPPGMMRAPVPRARRNDAPMFARPPRVRPLLDDDFLRGVPPVPRVPPQRRRRPRPNDPMFPLLHGMPQGPLGIDRNALRRARPARHGELFAPPRGAQLPAHVLLAQIRGRNPMGPAFGERLIVEGRRVNERRRAREAEQEEVVGPQERERREVQRQLENLHDELLDRIDDLELENFDHECEIEENEIMIDRMDNIMDSQYRRLEDTNRRLENARQELAVSRQETEHERLLKEARTLELEKQKALTEKYMLEAAELRNQLDGLVPSTSGPVRKSLRQAALKRG